MFRKQQAAARLSTSPADGYCARTASSSRVSSIHRSSCMHPQVHSQTAQIRVSCNLRGGQPTISLIAWSTLGISAHGSLWHKYPAIVCWCTFTCFTMRLSLKRIDLSCRWMAHLLHAGSTWRVAFLHAINQDRPHRIAHVIGGIVHNVASALSLQTE